MTKALLTNQDGAKGEKSAKSVKGGRENGGHSPPYLGIQH